MIIHSVLAENVLKYAHLSLNNLPEKALIAISGSNESGKTAIVETICFALFGRTFSLPDSDINKIIRWGETSCSVELEFSLSGGEKYRITRTLANDGIQGATLKKVNDHQVIASGALAVEKEIINRAGFTFQQYLDSIYLAQREISSPKSQSDTIKAVAGGVELESVIVELQSDIKEETVAVKKILSEMELVQEKINALGIEEDSILVLEKELDELDQTINANETSINTFRQVTDDLTVAIQRISDACKEVVASNTGLSFSHWRDYANRLSAGLSDIETSCNKLETDNPLCEGVDLKNYIWEHEGRLSAFDAVRSRATELRKELAIKLGENDELDEATKNQHSLPQKQAKIESELKSAKRWKSLSTFNFLIVFLLTVAVWAGWWFLVKIPDHEYSLIITDFLNTYASFWKSEYLQWLLKGAMGLSVLLVILLIRLMSHSKKVNNITEQHVIFGRKIETLRHQADLLDYMDSMALPHALESMSELDDDILSEHVEAFSEGPGLALLDDDELATLKRRTRTLMKQSDIEIQLVREDIAAAIGGLDNENERCRREIAVAAESIERENEKRLQASQLSEVIENLSHRIPVHEGQKTLLQKANDLVQQTCQDLYSRFNRVLRQYTGNVMPKLTDGRYQHLQIDDDLNVRVFSSDKNDFANLGEVSSGTQRQIMLAVRLAMAKALTEASVKHKQFLVLDEPFAFFDQQRIRSTLVAMPDIDQNLSQIWVIAQEFMETEYFTLHLDCSRDTTELVFNG